MINHCDIGSFTPFRPWRSIIGMMGSVRTTTGRIGGQPLAGLIDESFDVCHPPFQSDGRKKSDEKIMKNN